MSEQDQNEEAQRSHLGDDLLLQMYLGDTDELSRHALIAELRGDLRRMGLDRFRSPGGTGFAAEEVNAIFDRICGKNVEMVGRSNALNGPDRISDGIAIQSKYFQDAPNTIRSAFDSTTGQYRYSGQLLEVPKDQYNECIRLMRERISSGKVPGVNDPDFASEIVKQGNVTYNQAKNVARHGTIEGLLFDATNHSVSTLSAFGISFAIEFGHSVWSGKSVRESCLSGLNAATSVASAYFLTAVISSQLLRTDAAGVLTTVCRNGVRHVSGFETGRSAIDNTASALAGRELSGSTADNHVSRVIRDGFVVSSVMFCVSLTPDIYRAVITRSISGEQLLKNAITTGGSITGGICGGTFGRPLGRLVATTVVSAILPGAGEVAGEIGEYLGMAFGAIVGSCAGSYCSKRVADLFLDDDATKMVALLKVAVSELCYDYMLNDREMGILTTRIATHVNREFLRNMFQAGSGKPNSDQARKNYGYCAIERDCRILVAVRDMVQVPSVRELNNLLA